MNTKSSTDKSVIRSWRLIQLVLVIAASFGTYTALTAIEEKRSLQEESTSSFEGEVPTFQ